MNAQFRIFKVKFLIYINLFNLFPNIQTMII